MNVDIEARVEAIKDHLDILQKSMLIELDFTKAQMQENLIEFNREAHESIQDCQVFSTKMEQTLQDFECNRELIEKQVYECQRYIDDLNDIENKFRTILRQVSFEPSDWMPTEELIFPNIEKVNAILPSNFDLD